LHRPGGLSEADRAFARQLVARFEAGGRPAPILRVLGPGSQPEVAGRLVSRDGTAQIVAVPLSTSFVAPLTHETVAWLRAQAREPALPAGLELLWTGDAVLGRDFMADVQVSLDRAALATVVLLLGVLLLVYRSLWLALVPLTTIGVSLIISRGILAWLVAGAGWEVSPLVELFLVAVLFGSGTDFCLFISWRYGEHWNPHNPAGAMRVTLRHAILALLTSSGTVLVGLSLMGTTRFKLFSSTGPSVAIGLVLALAATLTLTPALLVLLAQLRPQAYAGLTRPSSGFWERFGRKALARPALSWGATMLVMVPLAVVGLKSHFVMDVVSELPEQTESGRGLRLLATKFDPGMVAPLTIVLESEADLRGSEGLALIDDVSRFLARHRRLLEVRSATQPLGSPAPLGPARLASRLGAVDSGFAQMADGARELEKGLNEGAAKLRAALWLERRTGLKLTAASPSKTASKDAAEDPRAAMLRDLTLAAEGAGRIADGAGRARREVGSILADPVGRRALDHLLIDHATVAEHPELERSFAAYLSPDGRAARIDVSQSERVFSVAATDQVVILRQKLNAFLNGAGGPPVKALVGGPNAESADIRALTEADQFQSWFVVPLGVFFVLVVALRDPLGGVNLVATMLLTYAFALGATHVLFVTLLGAGGIDWKVAYFLFVLLVAVGVDYNVFLMDRVREESKRLGLRGGLIRAVGQTGGLITSAAAITACSFASFMISPLGSLRQLGFALVVGITVDAVLVRPLLVPCGHWLLRGKSARPPEPPPRRTVAAAEPAYAPLVKAGD
ncbi:MAG: MMPL family transporter, partial [Isosphaeraceae bacterium]|nr:MMPL family transporter [Isosphaeraceae bacterium]